MGVLLGDGARELGPSGAEGSVGSLDLLGVGGRDDDARPVSHAERETEGDTGGRRLDPLDGFGLGHGPHVQDGSLRLDHAAREEIGPRSPRQGIEGPQNPHGVDDAVGGPAHEGDVDRQHPLAVKGEGARWVAPADAEYDHGDHEKEGARPQRRPGGRSRCLRIEERGRRGRPPRGSRKPLLYGPREAIEVDFLGPHG